MWLYKDGELQHHGVKGQKWGVRRYQTKSGKLTAAGKKRYLFGFDSKKKEADKKAAAKAKASSSTKSVKDMSDDELKKAIERLRLEEDYKQRYDRLNPQKVNKGKQFVDKAVIPAIEEAGKQLIKDTLIKVGKNALGLNEKQTKSLEELAKDAENQWKKLDYEKKIKDLKNTKPKEKSELEKLDEKKRKLELERTIAALEKQAKEREKEEEED